MAQFISIKKMNKKAQAWSLDIVIATVIFMIGLVLLYFYAINYASDSKGQLENLFYEGQLASELILSTDDFGVLSENEINQTKIDEYTSSYSSKKAVLGVTHDFYFDIDGNTYGKMNNTPTEDLVKITRIAIYNKKPIKFELFVWQ